MFISYNTWNSTNDTNYTTMEIWLANSTLTNDGVWSTSQITHNNQHDEYPSILQDAGGLFSLFFAHDAGAGLRLVYLNRALQDADARNVTIWDAIPPNTTLVNGSITAGGVVSNGTITWSLANIQGGRNGVVSFKVTVDPSIRNGSLVNNTAFMNYSDSNGTLVETLNSSSSTTILGDTLPPAIDFVSPTPADNASLNQTYIQVNVTANDTNLANITIFLYNSSGSLINSSTAGSSPDFFNFTGLPDGVYSINATAYDLAGNSNSTTTRSVTLDTHPPLVSLVGPPNNASLNSTSQNFTFNYTNNLSQTANCSLLLDGVANQTNISVLNSTNTNFSVSGLAQGQHNWSIQCTDLAGNMNTSSSRNFTIDTIPPTINFNAPTPANGSFLSQSSIPVNVTANDTNLASITIFLYNSSGSLINSSTAGSSPDFFNFTGLPDGVYYINATANDSAGNSNSTATWTVNLDTHPPSITIQSPQNITYANTTLPLNYTVSDNINVSTCWYYLDGAGPTALPGCLNTTLAGITPGGHNITVFVNDSANNTNSSTVIFTIGCPVITAPTTYVMTTDFIGSPNNASPIGGYACVMIASSNVTFDCNGFNITGTSNATPTYGILLNGSLTNVTLKDCPGISDYTDGIYVLNSTNTVLSNDSVLNDSDGIYISNSSSTNINGTNSTDNTDFGIVMDSGTNSTDISSGAFCSNAIDVQNSGSADSGAIDRCDAFLNWSEDGHYGCEYSCSNLWQRFFGNASGNVTLRSENGTVYIWNASALNIYVTASNSSIDWNALQAIGRTVSNTTSSNDFIELDNTFNTSAFPDNITALYSSDGTHPLDTRDYTVYGRNISSIPVANSTHFTTAFKTGILWDTSKGGTEYSNAYNQSTVWMVRVNASSADTYGTYDFLTQIPSTLAKQDGSTTVSIYLELN